MEDAKPLIPIPPSLRERDPYDLSGSDRDDEGTSASATVARRWHLLGFGVLTAIAFYSVVEALILGLWRQNSPGEGLFPFIASIAMTAFALIGLASAWRMIAPPTTTAIANDTRITTQRVASYLIGLVFYALALDALGFIASTVITVVFIMRLAERYSWLASLALAIGTAAGCQVLFVSWLGAILPTGYLWDSLLH